MNVKHVVKCLSALAHHNRFEVFRALVQAGNAGMTPGMLNENLGIAPATMSFHLKELANADLVDSHTEGRRVIYRANYRNIESMIGFVMSSCCVNEKACADAMVAKPAAKVARKAVARKPAAKVAKALAPAKKATARRSTRSA